MCVKKYITSTHILLFIDYSQSKTNDYKYDQGNK